MKRIIVPAILAPTFTDITRAIEQVEDCTDYVQIDMVDGIFAPVAPTWPFSAPIPVKALEQINNLTISYSLDLFVARPEALLPNLLATSASRLIFHLNSTEHMHTCLSQCKAAGKEAYLGIGIDASFSVVASLLPHVDGVQCMGIRQVGVQGEPYDSAVERSIISLSKHTPSLPITVDGGVSFHHLAHLAELGVQEVAVGSALFRGDVEENFKRLSAEFLQPQL